MSRKKPVEPETYTSGSTHPAFEAWWAQVGARLQDRLSIELMAMAAWVAADDRARLIQQIVPGVVDRASYEYRPTSG